MDSRPVRYRVRMAELTFDQCQAFLDPDAAPVDPTPCSPWDGSNDDEAERLAFRADALGLDLRHLSADAAMALLVQRETAARRAYWDVWRAPVTEPGSEG